MAGDCAGPDRRLSASEKRHAGWAGPGLVPRARLYRPGAGDSLPAAHGAGSQPGFRFLAPTLALPSPQARRLRAALRGALREVRSLATAPTCRGGNEGRSGLPGSRSHVPWGHGLLHPGCKPGGMCPQGHVGRRQGTASSANSANLCSPPANNTFGIFKWLRKKKYSMIFENYMIS